jgi:xylulokinase
MLGNANVGAHLLHADFNRHGHAHVARATQEGIAMSFHHGMDILRDTGVDVNAPDGSASGGGGGGVIRAGHANLFLSPLFRQTLATLAGVTLELYDTDGSVGAARGAGIGVGAYASPAEAFSTLKRVGVCEPRANECEALREAYTRWSEALRGFMRD